MAKATRKKKKGRKTGLGTLPAIKNQPQGITAKQLGLVLGSFAVGSAAGTVVGTPSGIAGILLGGAGFLTKNLYLTSLGAGMFFSSGVKAATQQGLVGTQEDMEGFDMDAIKGRAKAYFQMLGKKLYLPMAKQEETASTTTTDTATNGLNGDEQVSYFINPYTQRPDQVNMSDLDKVHANISAMSGNMGDLEPEEKNY
jgi:hypothetical protein